MAEEGAVGTLGGCWEAKFEGMEPRASIVPLLKLSSGKAGEVCSQSLGELGEQFYFISV